MPKEMELQELLSQAASCNTVTLSSDLPSSKTEFLIAVVRSVLRNSFEVSYLDLDLLFSSYICNVGVDNSWEVKTKDGSFVLIQPKTENLKNCVIQVVSHTPSKMHGIVVLDSINTVQNMMREPEWEKGSLKANHKAAVLLTLLEQAARHYSQTVWISNVTRARPKLGEGGLVYWEKSVTGGRMIKHKSDLILSVYNRKASSSMRENHSSKLKTVVEYKSNDCNCNLDIGDSCFLDRPEF